MASWSSNKKHLPSEINGGNQYEIKDRVTLEQLNAITENSFYAVSKSEEAESTSSDALHRVEQVIASKGYYGSNPNLLINGDFRVNQRGQTEYSYTTTGGVRVYTVDRWQLWAGNSGTFNVNTKTLTGDASGSGNVILSQFIEDTNILLGKTLTMSAKIDGNIYSITGTVPSQIETSDKVVGIYEQRGDGVIHWYIRMMLEKQRGLLRIDVGCRHGSSLTIDYAKLEIGSIATSFSPRPYSEELTLCQRYYQRITYDNIRTMFTGANTSLYCKDLSGSLFRTPPTVKNFGLAQIRHQYNGTVLTNATELVVTYYMFGGIGGNTLRFEAKHENSITAQDTNLFIQNVELDAEMY